MSSRASSSSAASVGARMGRRPSLHLLTDETKGRVNQVLLTLLENIISAPSAREVQQLCSKAAIELTGLEIGHAQLIGCGRPLPTQLLKESQKKFTKVELSPLVDAVLTPRAASTLPPLEGVASRVSRASSADTLTSLTGELLYEALQKELGRELLARRKLWKDVTSLDFLMRAPQARSLWQALFTALLRQQENLKAVRVLSLYHLYMRLSDEHLDEVALTAQMTLFAARSDKSLLGIDGSREQWELFLRNEINTFVLPLLKGPFFRGSDEEKELILRRRNGPAAPSPTSLPLTRHEGASRRVPRHRELPSFAAWKKDFDRFVDGIIELQSQFPLDKLPLFDELAPFCKAAGSFFCSGALYTDPFILNLFSRMLRLQHSTAAEVTKRGSLTGDEHILLTRLTPLLLKEINGSVFLDGLQRALADPNVPDALKRVCGGKRGAKLIKAICACEELPREVSERLFDKLRPRSIVHSLRALALADPIVWHPDPENPYPFAHQRLIEIARNFEQGEPNWGGFSIDGKEVVVEGSGTFACFKALLGSAEQATEATRLLHKEKHETLEGEERKKHLEEVRKAIPFAPRLQALTNSAQIAARTKLGERAPRLFDGWQRVRAVTDKEDKVRYSLQDGIATQIRRFLIETREIKPVVLGSFRVSFQIHIEPDGRVTEYRLSFPDGIQIEESAREHELFSEMLEATAPLIRPAWSPPASGGASSSSACS